MPQFRLSQLLRLRRLQDDQASADLARAHGRARETEASVVRARRALAGLGDATTELGTLRAIAAARSASTVLLDELREQQVRDAIGVAAAAAVHREASTRARALGRLEERWRLEEEQAELRGEQAALDEFAGARRPSAAARRDETGKGAVA